MPYYQRPNEDGMGTFVFYRRVDDGIKRGVLKTKKLGNKLRSLRWQMKTMRRHGKKPSTREEEFCRQMEKTWMESSSALYPTPKQHILSAVRLGEPGCAVQELTYMESSAWPWVPVCLDEKRWRFHSVCLRQCVQRGCGPVSSGRTLALNLRAQKGRSQSRKVLMT